MQNRRLAGSPSSRLQTPAHCSQGRGCIIHDSFIMRGSSLAKENVNLLAISFPQPMGDAREMRVQPLAAQGV